MDYQAIESSKKQHYEDVRHTEALNVLVIEQEYKLFAMLKPTLYKDGDQWLCVYDDIQTGIVGFGETPHKAVMDWNNMWHKNK